MDKRLQKVIKQIEQFDNITLVKSDEKALENALKVLGEDAPSQVKEWYSFFNGALLGTSAQFASTRKKHKNVNWQFYTLKEINSLSYKKNENIPKELICFGVENTGDPICFKKGGGKKVYSYFREEDKLIEYKDLADYLQDSIDNVIKPSLNF